ncbi:uncharacterized protein PRCAT00006141001 [Priceomyces carsonii]|uniref:uncharacterized protein n=1 Tax=Priceomyces carsonii TaxID=28549 RepID=UPI002ED824D0|nr:unnamed protein product [Priceomyces carsonii]
MFKAQNDYFSNIECPDLKDNGVCTVLNCIFGHRPNRKRSDDNTTDDWPRKRSKEDLNDQDSWRLKNDRDTTDRFVNQEEESNRDDIKLRNDARVALPKTLNHLKISRDERTLMARKLAEKFALERQLNPNHKAIDTEFEWASGCKTVEEYRTKAQAFFNREKEAPKEDPRFIMPREVLPSSPATMQVRKRFIQLLADAIHKAEPDLSTPVLHAIDEEYNLASSNSTNTYQHSVKRKIYEINHPERFIKSPKELSDDDYLRSLNSLVIPPDVLEKYGYIMEIPSTEPLKRRQLCKRCNTEFALEDQLKPTKCYYHSGRAIKVGNGTRAYDCCGAIVGSDSEPCCLSEHHVFYLTDPKELQYVQPFQRTTEIFGRNPQCFKAVGIDCEMGYTTMGFELLRITAIDFFTGEEVIDILTRPNGKIIDLNTRWSGISEIKPEALNFEELIKLLGEVIDADTILIGHGLENDLNSMRLLHSRIVDTAVLYPKHKTSPTFRFSLKNLAFKYLGRTIQTGQHDSGEDSLAAIDVVKYFINKDYNS